MIEEEKKTTKSPKSVEPDVEKAKREDLQKQQKIFSVDASFTTQAPVTTQKPAVVSKP